MIVSAVIITRNEECHIERCLRSLSFCQEIIVIDSGSTDKTEVIARKYCTRFEIRTWSGFSKQKNFANSLAKSDWILSLDGDEEIPDDLRGEIENLESGLGGAVAYSLARKTFYAGRWIRHGGWYPNRVVRLFNRQHGRWVDLPVHEFWQTSGVIGELKNDLIHYSFAGIADQVERNNHYSSLGTSILALSETRFSIPKLLLKPMTKFFETYIWKRGFLDGLLGLIISISAAYSVFLKWAKLWELNQREAKS